AGLLGRPGRAICLVLLLLLGRLSLGRERVLLSGRRKRDRQRRCARQFQCEIHGPPRIDRRCLSDTANTAQWGTNSQRPPRRTASSIRRSPSMAPRGERHQRAVARRYASGIGSSVTPADDSSSARLTSSATELTAIFSMTRARCVFTVRSAECSA